MQDETKTDERRPYLKPVVEIENFYEEIGVFGSDCSSHYCMAAGICSSTSGYSCQ